MYIALAKVAVGGQGRAPICIFYILKERWATQLSQTPESILLRSAIHLIS